MDDSRFNHLKAGLDFEWCKFVAQLTKRAMRETKIECEKAKKKGKGNCEGLSQEWNGSDRQLQAAGMHEKPLQACRGHGKGHEEGMGDNSDDMTGGCWKH